MDYNGDEIATAEWDVADDQLMDEAMKTHRGESELALRTGTPLAAKRDATAEPRHVRPVVERTMNVTLSAAEIATAISAADNETQAEFFLRLAEQWRTMGGDGSLQMSWLSDALTREERLTVAAFLEELRGYIQPE